MPQAIRARMPQKEALMGRPKGSGVIASSVRFWRRVQKSETGCWIWIGAKNRGGYGVFDTRLAHRFSWTETHGAQADRFVLHKCDNPPCVRPDHLFEGGAKENTDDAKRKGRLAHGKRHSRRMREVAARGEANGASKLTITAVVGIIRRGADGESQRKLAEEFGVGPDHISRILSGKRWAHLRSKEV